MPTIYVSQTATTSGGITFGIGSDTNNYAAAQNPATPLLTLDTAVTGAFAKAVSGDTIIINDGTYTAATFHNITSKTLTINPATSRQVVLKRTGAQSRVLNINNAAGETVTLGALIIDGEDNSGTGGISVTSAATAPVVTLNGTIIRNCTGTSGFASNSAQIKATFNGVDIRVTNTASIRTVTSLTSGSYIIIQDNSYIDSVNSGATVDTVAITSSATGAFAIVRNSTILHTNTGATVTACLGFNNTRHLVENCKLYKAGSSTGASFYRNGSAAAVLAENSIFRWNQGYSTNTGSGGYLLYIGSDGTGVANDNQVNYPVVYGNYLVGSSVATLEHGIFLGWMKGGCVTGNVVISTAIPLISKSQSERSYWVNNVADRGVSSTSGMLRSKGSTGTIFCGNSVRSDSTSQNPVVLIDSDPTPAVNSTGVDVFGNNFKVAWTATTIDKVAASSDAEFGFNNYDVDGVSGNPFAYGASNFATVAAWTNASTGQEPTGTALTVTSKDPNYFNKLSTTNPNNVVPIGGTKTPWGQ